jgi:hypothetical protein
MKSQQPPLMNASFTADIVSATATQRRLIPKRRLAALSRWLHIYLSMASFAILLFFAVTGLTLNHAERFSAQPRATQIKGKMPCGLTARSRCWKRALSLLLESKFFIEVSQSY